jgi:hypothetical protein
MALTGANQLDAAMRQLQADTGMTDAAAKLAEHSIAGMYQNNLQGIDQIGASLAVVINGLDLTGTAADAMTQKFLAFETATGQDSSAVTAFHEILNAWGLDASKAPGIMDQLTASHQKYGGAVTELQSSLATIAPAMRAMNMTVEDGIGFLNLLDVAGISAAKAPMALNAAIKQLKPGQNLNDLIAKISAIVDPTLRAQAAMKLLGARGGTGMAQAFAPGITAVSDYGFTVDEVAGKTEEAAKRIEASLGNQAVLILHGFKGVLADFATTLGTSGDAILMAAALLGPRLATGLLAGFGGAAGLLVPRLAAMLTANVMPWMTTGTMIGTTIGTAATLAALVAVPIAIGAILLAARDEWKKQTAAWGLNVPDLFSGQGPLAPNAGIVPVGTQTTYSEGNAAAHQAAMEEAGASDAAAIAAGLASGAPEVLAASKDLGWNVLDGVSWFLPKFNPAFRVAADQVVATFGTTLVAGVKKAAAHTGIEGMLALAAGITSARQAPLDAFDAMVAMLKAPMTSTQEAARLAGELTSQSLADGLRSHDPEIHAQAIAVKREILARLEELQTAKGIGSAAMDELNAGIRSKDPEIRKAAETARDAVLAGLEADAKARAIGATAGTAYVDGLTSTARLLPRTTGAKHGATGLENMTAGMPYIVGEYRPELFIPETNGRLLPSVPAGFGAAGREQNFNFYGPIQLADAHDEFSLTQQLQFLASVG